MRISYYFNAMLTLGVALLSRPKVELIAGLGIRPHSSLGGVAVWMIMCGVIAGLLGVCVGDAAPPPPLKKASSLKAGAVASDTSTTKKPAPSPDKNQVSLTIYADGIVMVKDRRWLNLSRGIQSFDIQDVSAEMIPSTALVRTSAPKGTLDTLEQSFHGKAITQEALLLYGKNAHVQVRLTPKGAWHQGVLLNNTPPYMVKTEGKIAAVAPDDLAFQELPATLTATPTLRLTAHTTAQGPTPIELSYLTRGLEWGTNYIAEITPDGKMMDLGAWVTLKNTGSTTYKNSFIKLAAANTSWWQDGKTNPDQVSSDIRSTVKFQRLIASPTYALPRSVTLGAHTSKQISLLQLSHVKLNKTYHLKPKLALATNSVGLITNQEVETWFSFVNTQQVNMPKGPVYLYRRDDHNTLQYVGTDTVRHTPVQGRVTLRLGNSQNVRAMMTQIDHKDLGRGNFEAGYKLTLVSSQTHPVGVTVTVPLPSGHRIIKESQPPLTQETTSKSHAWHLKIGPQGKTNLTFRVRGAVPVKGV